MFMVRIAESEAATTGPKLWVVLARAHRALASYVEESIAAQGLCLSDFMVLEVLLHKGPLPISAIGERVLLANASMTAAVDRLTQRDLVVRHESEQDRRSKIVALTARGRALISDLYDRHKRDIEEVTSSLTPRDQEQLRSLLKKLGLSAQVALEKRVAGRVAPSAKSSRDSKRPLARI